MVCNSQTVTAHIDFVRAGIESYGNDDDDGGSDTCDAGPAPYDDAAPDYPTSCSGDTSSAYPGYVTCNVTATESGGTSTLQVSGVDTANARSFTLSISVPGAFKVTSYDETNTTKTLSLDGSDGGVLAELTQSPGNLSSDVTFSIDDLGASSVDGGTTTWSTIHGGYTGAMIDTGAAQYTGLRISF